MTKDEAQVIAKFISLSSKSVFKEIFIKECVDYCNCLSAVMNIVNKYLKEEQKQVTQKPKMSLKNANK